MEQFVVSARKYRPRKFEEVVGQQGVTHTLKNAISSGHLAHALLFCGPRGVGKTTCARILSRMINSELPPDQFNPSAADQEIDRFNIYELDAASNNSVDDIRALVDQVRFPPQTGKYKVYIIDEVHMLSTAAFNAFLKTLEEPPSYAIFILATTEKHKILPTILSRCQIYDFNRITIDDTVGHLNAICEQEGITADPNALHIIAQKADGALRDALSLFDRLVDYGEKKLTYQSVLENLNILDYDYFFRVTDMLMAQDLTGLMLLFDEVVRHGFEGDNFITGLEDHFRNLMVSKHPETIKILEVSDDLKQRYLEQGQLIPNGFLLNALNLANKCEVHYKTSKNKRLHVELALMKMCYLPSMIQATADASKKNSIADDAGGATASKSIENKVEPIVKPSADTANAPSVPQQTEAEVIPDPAPAQTPAATKVVKPATEVKKKLASSLTGGVSLKQTTLAKEETPKEEEDQGPSAEELADMQIDEAKLKKAWASFVEHLREQKRMNLLHLVEDIFPTIEGGMLTVTLTGKIKQELFESEKVDMLTYLKEQLGVEQLGLTSVIDTSQVDTNVRQAFTAKEKLLRMTEKNPNVRNLIEKLDLQIDD